jgi:hypothetical protein
VHDTAASTQGDGIELKTGSWACIISDNLVERTNYPGILVYGNGGRPERNVIERNVVIDALDNAVQVASDAIVRNNLIIGAGASALASQPHQDATPSNLDIVNNTIVNAGTALRASSWGGGIVVANNALYSETDAHVVGDTTTATMAGNVMLADLSGFADLAVDGSGRDATPTAASPAAGAGDPAWESADDLTGAARAGDPDAGAVDAD